uniref:Uncharacterized protein n=1 Tax=Anguilla anguilla TaxID=7936 RepID=A0A0E9S4K0_ANGAN
MILCMHVSALWPARPISLRIQTSYSKENK